MNPQTATLTADDYNKAMNFLGKNLLDALTHAVSQLPEPLRGYNVVSQAIAAFLANVVYKQSMGDAEKQALMLNEIRTIVETHLKNIGH